MGDISSKIVTGQFLNDLLQEFAKVSTELFNITGEMPFWYKERQLSSVLLPCFYNLGYGALQEIPTRRKPHGEDDSHGWLDYWVQRGDKHVFLMEVKHGWLFLGSQLLSDRNMKSWNEAIAQLKKIKKNQRDLLFDGMAGHRVAFMVLPIWRTLKKAEEGKLYKNFPTPEEDLCSLADRILDTKNLDLDWMGIWSLPADMQYVFENKKQTRRMVIPGVIMLAKII
ncbi:hypothetical protein JCM30471_08290 [Desulfuromonas carbonis]